MFIICKMEVIAANRIMKKKHVKVSSVLIISDAYL